MFIEILILIAILVEIVQSWLDRRNQEKVFKKMLEVLEDSNAELADIRDETVSEDELVSDR
jgi:FtsZ-interacting cell division protein ZipA